MRLLLARDLVLARLWYLKYDDIARRLGQYPWMLAPHFGPESMARVKASIAAEIDPQLAKKLAENPILGAAEWLDRWLPQIGSQGRPLQGGEDAIRVFSTWLEAGGESPIQRDRVIGIALAEEVRQACYSYPRGGRELVRAIAAWDARARALAERRKEVTRSGAKRIARAEEFALERLTELDKQRAKLEKELAERKTFLECEMRERQTQIDQEQVELDAEGERLVLEAEAREQVVRNGITKGMPDV